MHYRKQVENKLDSSLSLFIVSPQAVECKLAYLLVVRGNTHNTCSHVQNINNTKNNNNKV